MFGEITYGVISLGKDSLFFSLFMSHAVLTLFGIFQEKKYSGTEYNLVLGIDRCFALGLLAGMLG